MDSLNQVPLVSDKPTEGSILDDVKKLLGLEPDYRHFDVDIITHINSAIFTLNQLGIGPKAGYAVKNEFDTWTDYVPNVIQFEALKSYIYIKVKLIFDRPETSFAITSLEGMAKEYEWRLQVHAEGG